ncbi:hypothetical protein M501DRAFT_934417 [Patellaria atrata CBS 101060]|uniref:White collar n=1 Tax=Patellaria atrata CBS 101060 TaxID=1346257 RepID=A0A9P4S9I4_9PEZI|nr:hypothetical protein M501DRAFT_934417 [Patellaria atrata CBS 101060]
MGGSRSLDDIVNQNSAAMRRRSIPMQYGSSTGELNSETRRVSMLDFGGQSSRGSLQDFQFDPNAGMLSAGIQPADSKGIQFQQTSQIQSLPLTAQFAINTTTFSAMAQSGSTYASPIHPTGSMDMDIGTPYDMSLPLDLSDPNLTSIMTNDVGNLSLFSPDQFTSPIMRSPIQQDFPTSMQNPTLDATSQPVDLKEQLMDLPTPQDSLQNNLQPESRPQSNPSQGSSVSRVPSASGTSEQLSQTPHMPPRVNSQGINSTVALNLPWAGNTDILPSTMCGRPHMQTQFQNIYSSSGFDMMGVIMRVATRPRPVINIGSVDLSCAFVVCDATLDDNPIVYCSENFERLTGYSKHMILGRNCRFLQSPDGSVEAGVKRKYVDDDSVLYLKNMVNKREEAQISLINYRRGGQPFMNLLTMIPIAWDTDEIKYIVGFQVDLVEQPNSVTNKNPDGSYSINYQRAVSMPTYRFNAPESSRQLDLGQTVTRDDVSTVLNTIVSGESELSKRIWDKVLLENTDDVVHVLSLKGLFLYLSPSCRRVLEYEAGELVGTALSSVCHPSDIVPVTRELKDTSGGASVNIVFRIRRKHSGYMWFEGQGSLHTEQGKGRKCIIMVGRERPVYTLGKSDVVSAGGIGDSELWTKMSTSGMFLFVSSHVRSLLDRQPDELVGMSIQSFMRQESKPEFGRILELARSGKKGSVKHEMINKRGQVLQAYTTIYPGDALEGQKPTFLVAQTRLLKTTRGPGIPKRPSLLIKHDRDSESQLSIGSSRTTKGEGTPLLNANSNVTSNSQFKNTEGAVVTYSGQNGLALGHQDAKLASEDNIFEELKTTRSTSWQYELRQMEKRNRLLAEEVQSLLAAKKKRKRRRGAGQLQKDCANCHTKVTPEWRRGPSGNRDLCNSCGLRWAKQNGRVSPRNSSAASAPSDRASQASASPLHHQMTLPTLNEVQGKAQVALPSERRSHSFQNSCANHSSKVNRMDLSGSDLTHGIPPKIEEGDEPE